MALSSGKYFSEVAAGRVFIGSTAAAGVAIPVETGTAVTFALWNTSTAKIAVPLWIAMSYLSGTITIGGFGLSNQYCGFALATAAPLSAFTDGTPKNALLGNGDASSMRFAPATATLTAGGTRCYSFGFGQQIATAGPGVSVMQHDFDGKLAVPSGQMIFVTENIVTTALYNITMAWAEIPA